MTFAKLYHKHYNIQIVVRTHRLDYQIKVNFHLQLRHKSTSPPKGTGSDFSPFPNIQVNPTAKTNVEIIPLRSYYYFYDP